MRQLRLTTLFLLILCCISSAISQNKIDNIDSLFSGTFASSKKKIKGGKFIGQVVKGKCSGMGSLLSKDKSIYVGDFYRDEIQGIGMMISPQNADIQNCAQSKVYVGNFVKGEKSGFGKCYDHNGQLIYAGTFLNDAPTSQYPQAITDTTRYVKSFTFEDNSYFVGEYVNNIPSGFGVFIMDNGTSLWQSQFKEGQRVGIGLYISSNGEWQTMNVSNGESQIISSSEYYREIESISKANFRKSLSEAFNAFSQCLVSSAQIASNVKQIKSGTYITENAPDLPDVSNVSSSSPTTNSSGNKYNVSEQNNYNTDKRTWGNYDSMLASHFAGNKPATKNDVVKWQQAMKKLRSKWTSKGKSFPQSANENKSTSGCANGSHSH